MSSFSIPPTLSAGRYNYLYSPAELQSFVPALRKLSRKAKAVHVLFNNCDGGFAMRNALEMRGMLTEQGIPSKKAVILVSSFSASRLLPALPLCAA